MGKVLKDFNFKKAVRKCDVRGCPNCKDVYAVSHAREAGHSILMCREDIENIGAAFQKFLESQPDKPTITEPKPPPFFSAGVVETVEDNKGDNTGTGNTGDTELKCQYCGKVCANKLGLGSHERNCKENPEKNK